MPRPRTIWRRLKRRGRRSIDGSLRVAVTMASFWAAVKHTRPQPLNEGGSPGPMDARVKHSRPGWGRLDRRLGHRVFLIHAELRSSIMRDLGERTVRSHQELSESREDVSR